MLLAHLVHASAAVGATSGRREKVDLLAAALRGLAADEVVIGVAALSGETRPRQLGVGWAALRELPAPAPQPSITVAQLGQALVAISVLEGRGSVAARRDALALLLARATPDEQRFLRALLSGELRQGALEGVMVAAVAAASGATVPAVQRAFMLRGDLPIVAQAALDRGPDALHAFHLQVGRPVRPMLAGSAKSIDEGLEKLGEAAIEWKLDGARIQVHRDGDDVSVFTRSLEDVTARVPEVVAAALALPLRAAVFDGEAIALRADGRPEPFQVTGARFARRSDTTVPLTPFLFDVLHLDGEDLIDEPAARRAEVLAAVVPEAARTPRALVGADAPDAAHAFLADALDRGHEGVMLKALDQPYAAGRRGGGWLKVKPVHTLDLVILAAEWGSGRRRGTLSNLHLGARDPESGGFVMLGKTFKGLTDEMLAWQTQHLLELEVSRDDWVVRVRPQLVVEIAFDGVQTSRRYPGGVALRFARVIRHRPDKSAAEADTLDAVLAHHRR
jgi:ATP-dependent DNA ligase I